MNTPSLRASYQDTPYPSRPVPLSHPDHLYVVGRVHGLSPAPVAAARVLELGCGAGGNLLPMTASLPDARFLGLDLSERQVEMARAAARAAGLANVEFLAGDALVLAEQHDWPPFNYVILHGLYSWVPLPVRDALLPLCRRLLADNGIVYVSYNTYPGWHGRGLVRELMLRAACDATEPAARAARARAALDDLISAYAQTDDSYAKLLAEEKARVDELEDSFLLHDLLEVENHPIYLDEFLDQASAAGLRFVSEANVAASRAENLSPQAQQQLAAIAGLTAREQRIDFLLNRSFRQTLLCPGRLDVQRQINPAWLADLYLASSARPLRRDSNGAPGERFFATPDGGRIGMTAPGAIAALNHLAMTWPDFIAFEELAATVGDRDIVAQLAIDLYPRNWLELSPRPAGFATEPGPKPMATALTRWQITQGALVTDLRHRSVSITDPFTRQLLPYLDGSREREALISIMGEFERDNSTDAANDDPETVLAAALHQLAERCLLVQ